MFVDVSDSTNSSKCVSTSKPTLLFWHQVKIKAKEQHCISICASKQVNMQGLSLNYICTTLVYKQRVLCSSGLT